METPSSVSANALGPRLDRLPSMPSHLPPPSLNPSQPSTSSRSSAGLFLCFRTCTQPQLPAYVPTSAHTDTVRLCCVSPTRLHAPLLLPARSTVTSHCPEDWLCACACVCVCVCVTMGDGVLAEGNGGCHTRESGTVVCSSVPYKRTGAITNIIHSELNDTAR